MATLTSVTAYCTVSEADTILGIDEPWVSSAPADKSKALIQARIYIDSLYKCTWDENDGTPSNLKEANALLANFHLSKSLWERQDGLGPVTSKSVQAGSVKSSTTYKQNSGSNWIDPFPEVTALLAQNAICELTRGKSTISVVRQ